MFDFSCQDMSIKLTYRYLTYSGLLNIEYSYKLNFFAYYTLLILTRTIINIAFRLLYE